MRPFKTRRRDLAEDAPEVYKDVETVIRARSDLVDLLARLTPTGVVKG